MSKKSEEKMMTMVYQDSPDKIESYYKGKQLKFRTKRTPKVLTGPRYKNQNIETWKRIGIDINRKCEKPPLKNWEKGFDVFDEE